MMMMLLFTVQSAAVSVVFAVLAISQPIGLLYI